MRINVTRSSMPPFEEYCEEIRELWDTHWLTNNGVKVKALEQMLSKKLDAAYIALYTNGHQALEAVLRVMALRGEVITTPFSFASTTHALVRCGLTPVFGDIRPEDCTLDPRGIEALITERTCAILPVHVYGNLCDTDALQSIADKHHLRVIYDAAHAFGATRNGTACGAFGDASMFSFHATKVFNTIEGGAIATNDRSLYERLTLERNFGIAGPEDIPAVGGNAKMNEFQAAMGLCNLRHLDDDIAGRKRVYELYLSLLDGTPGLTLPKPQPGVRSAFAYLPVFFEDGRGARDAACAMLLQNDIFARKYFYPLITDYECYRGRAGFDSRLTPAAKRAADSVATLPLYPELAEEDVRLICKLLRGEK